MAKCNHMVVMNWFSFNKKFKDLNPLNCGSEKCSPKHRYGPAIRTSYLIHYVFSGEGTFYSRNQIYHLKAGEFFLITPNEITTYEASADNPWHYLWIDFNGELAKQLDQIATPIGKLPSKVFNELYINGIDNFNEWKGTIEEYITSALFRILADIFANKSPYEHYARRAETYIRTMFMQDITIDKIANSLSLDRRYLSRLFKKHYGQTMQEYLINTRLNNAAELLTKGYSVIESASLSGYSDPTNFSKMFHRKFGCSPSTYAKNSKTNLNE